MTIQLTDGQIARVLELSGKIARLQQSLPAAPTGFNVDLEIARALRTEFEKNNDVLLELGALLR